MLHSFKVHGLGLLHLFVKWKTIIELIMLKSVEETNLRKPARKLIGIVNIMIPGMFPEMKPLGNMNIFPVNFVYPKSIRDFFKSAYQLLWCQHFMYHVT